MISKKAQKFLLPLAALFFIGNSAHAQVKDSLNQNVKEKTIDEVVVIGYGTQKKSDLTGSVSKVKAKDLTAIVVPDPVLALQGRVSGVQISQNSGAPDGDFTIRVRGTNSIKGNNNPLYIVDGIPFDMYSINSNDIESIEILKDASATAIYGSRGSNGVILVTTKKGKSGRTKINYNFDSGYQFQIKTLDLMNAQEWARFYNEYLVNANILKAPAFTEEQLSQMGKGTDWQKLMFNNAPISNHYLSFSGGTNKTNYLVSGSALMREGLITNSKFNKYNLRSALNFEATPWMDISANLGYAKVLRMNQTNEGGVGGSSMIAAVYSASPYFTPYDENGNYNDLRSRFSWSSHELKNPVVIANESYYKTDYNINNINVAINLKPFTGFTFKTSFGVENIDSRYDAYTNSNYIYQNNSASVGHNRTSTFVNENIANYKTSFNDIHKLDAMAAVTYQEYVRKTLFASGGKFISDLPETNDLGSAETINTPKTSYLKWALLSYLGRINYSLSNKYYATLSIRADGSSRYSPGQRWGYFPSGALAWRISEENFLKNSETVSELKLRTSYGVTGSTAIDPYSTQNLLNTGRAATGNGNFTYYAPGSVYPGSLKWESTSQWDVGFDLGLLKNKLQLTADYYSKKTTDLLNTVYLPSSSGYTSTTKNIGEMTNKGYEISLNWNVLKNTNWDINTNFNFSHNKNRIEKLDGGDDIFGTTYASYASGSITLLREKQPLGVFYLYKDNGLDENGRLSYVDMNGDGKFTDAEDRYIAGSPFPDFTYGFSADIKYKRWYLNFLFQGSEGNKIFNISEMRNYSYGQGLNIEKKVYYDSWKTGQDNTNAKYPRIESVGSLKYSDRFLEDGSYLRLKNITLGYDIPNDYVQMKLFVTAQNFLTFTKYKGMDPEVSSKGGGFDFGIDHFSYPNSKTISLGANINF